ncbi:DUF3108 domain-containing protein [Dokdonella sp.]|uniref:DUF3108 domain-containing protein n=1 Tax=Dokdonella sp. TaxID=2291710 RepID=UPI0031BF1C37|nr:DUF3108 domain-containing protein [Dokdonella sp.]
MRVHPFTLGLALVLATSQLPVGATAATGGPVAAFHAEYVTSRNGKPAGRTTLDLHANADGSWSLTSETHGTEGLARLAGLHVVESTRLRWNEGRPEALSYDYRQSGGFRQRTRHADFDWASGTVTMRHGDTRHSYATVPGLIDRQTVTLAIMADLARGARRFDYKVATKTRVDELRYQRGATATVTVPAGSFEAVAVERLPDPGDRRARQSRNWFAPALGWLPVKMQQREEGGDTITLELRAWRAAPAPA